MMLPMPCPVLEALLRSACKFSLVFGNKKKVTGDQIKCGL